MEYLERLGLVGRKLNKKGRVASLPHDADLGESRRCLAAESAGGDQICKPRLSIHTAWRPLKTGTKCATKEPNALAAPTQQATGFVEIDRGTSLTELPRPSAAAVNGVDIADSFFPRTSTSGQEALIDMEFMEYQECVQARAHQALGKDNTFDRAPPGGRHAWKTLIFWKRRRTIDRATSPFVVGSSSSASTDIPLPGRKSSHHGSYRRVVTTPAVVPLYTSDEFSTSSIRANWWEPMVRGSGKPVSVSAGAQDDAEFCNMSPYVPLGGRPHRLHAAPLYLV